MCPTEREITRRLPRKLQLAQTQARQPDSKKTRVVSARDASLNVSSKPNPMSSGTLTCAVINSNKRKPTVPLEKQVLSDECIGPTKKSKKAVKLTDALQS